jgi:hypothetical protein
MTAQFKQVAITYVTRRSLWLVALFALVGAPMLVVAALDPGFRRSAPQTAAMFPLGIGGAMLAWMLLTQAKWQFCESRARLLPGFARAHLAVLAGLIMLGFGIFPPLAALACGWNVLGAASCMAGIGAAYIWTMHNNNWAMGLLTMVQLFSLATGPGLEFWVQPDATSKFLLVHAAIFVAAWTGLAAWLGRLPHLREEDSDYLIPIQAQQGSATRMERTQAARTLARQMSRARIHRIASDRWLDRLQCAKAVTTAARQWLLRYGYGPAPVALTAVFFTVSFGVMIVLMARYQITSSNSTREILPALPMLVIMPSFIVGGMFVMRRARLGHELLLPLSRRQFVNGLFLTAAWNAVVMWAVTHATLLGLISWAEPATLTPPFIIGMTALSLSVQTWAFAVAAWMSRLQSGGARMIGMILAIMPLVGVLAFGMEGLPRNPSPLPPDPGIAMLRQALVDGTFTTEERATVEKQISHMQEQQNRRQSELRERASTSRVAWTAGAGAVVGLGLLAYQRRRWMDTELG